MSSPAWTREQLAVLEASGVGIAVTAGAGAGKTSVLVEKCARLLSSRPDARICAVSFTERSAADLRLKLSRFDLSRHWVTTIHGLCGLILREFPEAAGVQGDERVLSEVEGQRLWNEAVERLWFDAREASDPEVAELQQLLASEGKANLETLLIRMRELETAGALHAARASVDPRLRALAGVCERVIRSYRVLKERAGAMDFADLERFARTAMEDARVRSVLQRRFDLVLVDEFQDTNAVQAGILWGLARADLSNLCVVGDPKQSIYRFRDADVSLFDELCSRLPIKLSLTHNFRSHPMILEWVNQVCEPVFEAASLEYEALKPGRSVDGTAGTGSTVPVLRLDIESEADLARHILREHAQGVPFEKMAILMRRIRGNERWIQALSRSGIPVAVGGGGLFWNDPRVLELVSLLKWWAHPGDEQAALTFLRAPWVGVGDGQLDGWLRGVSAEGRLDVFWQGEHPVARVLGRFRGRAARPAELLLALFSDPVTESLCRGLAQSLLGLVHRLDELSLQGLEFALVVSRIQSTIDSNKREKEVPPPVNRGVLPVLTIHASKGLEFERVYLVDLGAKPRAQRMPQLFWDRGRGVFLPSRDERGDKMDEAPDFLEWKGHEQRAALAESKRQFYVAITRAREQLVLACPALDEGEIEADAPKAATVEHWRAWIEHFGKGPPRAEVVPELNPVAPLQLEQAAALPALRSPPIPPAMERARHAVTEWALLSRCERAYVRTVLGAPQPEEQDGPEELEKPEELPNRNSSTVMSSVEIGKKVHGALEKWALFSSHRHEIERELLDLEAAVGPRRFKARPLLAWLGDSGWLDLPGVSEWPFEWSIEGVKLVGALDRLVEREGRLAVIDYKVFSALKEDPLLMELYRPQLELYAGAVAAHIGPENWRGIEAWIVQIAPEGVRASQVVLEPERAIESASKLAKRARELVADPSIGEANPRRQESCRLCPHESTCSVS